MRGGFLQAWSMTWAEIWSEIDDYPASSGDILAQIYSVISDDICIKSLEIHIGIGPLLDMSPQEIQAEISSRANATGRPTEEISEEIADEIFAASQIATRIGLRMNAASNRAIPARREMKLISKEGIETEKNAIAIINSAFEICRLQTNPTVADKFHQLIAGFIKKHNLIYDIDSGGNIHLSSIGLYTGLWEELKRKALSDPHSSGLLDEFLESLQQFYERQTKGNLKTCIVKKCNLMESVDSHGGSSTLSAQFNAATTWPNDRFKESGVKLYGFASSYPGLRHGSAPISQNRDLENHDLAAFCVMMTALSAYLNADISGGRIINGEE